MSDKKVQPASAGIHISGPNVPKTSVVVVRGHFAMKTLRVAKIYDRIGAIGGLFSDERLAEILRMEGPFSEVLVDCPLSVPPCVACSRPVCPGVVQCEDVAVAYMLSLSGKIRDRNRKRRRTLNPQTQRLWDVIRLAQGESSELEPSYSANMSPLVVRARTLQKRLRSVDPSIELKETSVHFTLKILATRFGLSPLLHHEYKNFEIGRERRTEVLEEIVKRRWCEPPSAEDLSRLCQSVETFQAFMTALVAAMLADEACAMEPKPYIEGEGWVYVPATESLLFSEE